MEDKDKTQHKETEISEDIKELFTSKKVGSSHIEQNSKTKDIKAMFLNKQKDEQLINKKTNVILYLNKERNIKVQNFIQELKKEGQDIKAQDVLYFLIDNYL